MVLSAETATQNRAKTDYAWRTPSVPGGRRTAWKPNRIGASGRVAQWESARFTRGRSGAEEVANRDFYRLEHAVVNGLRSKLNRAGLFFDSSDLRQFYIDAWKTLWLELA